MNQPGAASVKSVKSVVVFFWLRRQPRQALAPLRYRRLADAPPDRDSVPHAAKYTIASNSRQKEVKKRRAWGDFAVVEAMPPSLPPPPQCLQEDM